MSFPHCCFFFLFQIQNISKLAEVSQNSTLQLSENLRNMKNQSESEEEKMKLLIKTLKKFLLGKFFNIALVFVLFLKMYTQTSQPIPNYIDWK